MLALLIHSAFDILHSSLPVLAEVDPRDALKDTGFTAFLGDALLALSLAGNAALVWSKVSGKKDQVNISPQPFQVEKAKQYVSAEEFDGLKKQVSAISVKLESEYRSLLEAGSRREASIKDSIATMKDHIMEKIDESLKESYHRINEHETRISHAEGRLGMQKRPRD